MYPQFYLEFAHQHRDRLMVEVERHRLRRLFRRNRRDAANVRQLTTRPSTSPVVRSSPADAQVA